SILALGKELRMSAVARERLDASWRHGIALRSTQDFSDFEQAHELARPLCGLSLLAALLVGDGFRQCPVDFAPADHWIALLLDCYADNMGSPCTAVNSLLYRSNGNLESQDFRGDGCSAFSNLF